jgi:hypothetical protein
MRNTAPFGGIRCHAARRKLAVARYSLRSMISKLPFNPPKNAETQVSE